MTRVLDCERDIRLAAVLDAHNRMAMTSPAASEPVQLRPDALKGKEIDMAKQPEKSQFKNVFGTGPAIETVDGKQIMPGDTVYVAPRSWEELLPMVGKVLSVALTTRMVRVRVGASERVYDASRADFPVFATKARVVSAACARIANIIRERREKMIKARREYDDAIRTLEKCKAFCA